MKNKKWIVFLLCGALAVAAFIAGFSGAIDLTKQPDYTPGTQSDRLIGALITKEYLDLFDAESYFQDNASQLINGGMIDEQDAEQYKDRLYAELVPNKDNPALTDVVFEGIDGISIFCAYVSTDGSGYWTSSTDDRYSDGNMHLTDTEELERIEMEGTIYSSTLSGWKCFYVNPMYQTADGKIYVVSGSGNSFGGDVASGMSSSQTLTETKTTTINGETKTLEAEIKINFVFMDTPISVTVLQFDNENNVIAQDAYTADSIPMEIVPAKVSQYLVLEMTQKSLNGSECIERQLVQHTDDYAYTFSVREDGICVKQSIVVNWNN